MLRNNLYSTKKSSNTLHTMDFDRLMRRQIHNVAAEPLRLKKHWMVVFITRSDDREKPYRDMMDTFLAQHY